MSYFHHAAMRKLEELCRAHRFLTSDDLHDALETEPEQDNATGRVWQSAKQRRIAKPTGQSVPSKRPNRRGGMIQIWESNLRRPLPGDPSLDDFITERTGAPETNQGVFSL